MDIISYYTYMRYLATIVKEISHTNETPRFFRNWQEADEALRNTNMDNHVMILEDIEGGIEGVNKDSLRDSQQYGFYIMQNYPEKKFNEREIVLHNCKQVGFKVIAKMINDRNNEFQNLGKWEMRGFEETSVTYQEAEADYDNAIGFLFTFNIHNNLNLYYDSNNYHPDPF